MRGARPPCRIVVCTSRRLSVVDVVTMVNGWSVMLFMTAGKHGVARIS